MISAETRAQIRLWFFAEHWSIGTIAQVLRLHPDTVRHAIESDRFHRAQTLRACLTDPYVPFIRQTLDQHPRLRATRIYQMIRERGYHGSVIQLRRVVAILRPIRREPFLRLHTFPAEEAQVDWAHSATFVLAVHVAASPVSSSLCPTPVLCIWNFSSIKLWKTSCAAMSTPLQPGTVHRG